ncbi:hypothetical protein E4U41_006266 [Claviceps citrina]|nr:hypothetical protein E4U41_006266 [Claviceps citrina]
MTLPRLCLGDPDAAPTLAQWTSSLATVPSCALPCLVESVAKANCSAFDPHCVCVEHYTQISDLAAPCVKHACDLTDALLTKNLTETACNRPVRDRGGQYDALNISMGIITILLVIVRLAYKRFWSYRRELAYDDWAILSVLVLGIPCTAVNSIGLTGHGLGRDVWTIPPSTLTLFVEYFFVVEIFYVAEMALIKLSLSLFYLPIFPGTTIHRLLMANCILNAGLGVIFVLIAIFSCTPVSRYWTQYLDNNSTGYCIDLNLIAWLHSSFNIVLDVLMIALPLSQIKGLNMHWKKKVGVVLMFLMGTFVTIVTILRLQSLIYFSNSDNPTWDNWIIAWWSTIEVNVGMICTCLPTLRLILVRMAPRVFGSKASRNESHRRVPDTDNLTLKNSSATRSTPFGLSSNELSAMEEVKWDG